MPPKERAEVLVLAVVLVNPKESICEVKWKCVIAINQIVVLDSDRDFS